MSKKSSILITILLIAAAAGSRFMPHEWNMTPITAIALFSSVYLGVRHSFFIVTAAMFISDLFIGFYDWRVMLSVYLGFAMAGVIGILVRKYKTPVNILLGALGSSVFFFLFTNWAVWQFTPMYEHTIAGLIQDFTMAIPFFRNMLIGDLIYTGVLFGAYELAVAYSKGFRLNKLFAVAEVKQ